MKKCCALSAVLFVLMAVVTVSEVRAAIYKYTDKDGIVSFADDLQQVPKQYRAAAVIVQGESKEGEEKVKGADPERDRVDQQTVLQEGASNRQRSPRPLSERLMISGTVGIAVFLIIVLAGRQPELKNNKRLMAIVRNSLVGAMSLYLVIAHAKDVMTVFGMMDRAVEEAQQQSAEKGKKAVQAIKSFDAMFEQAQKAEKSLNAPPRDADQKQH